MDLRKLKIPKSSKRRKYSPSQDDVRLLNGFADSAMHHLLVALAYQHGFVPVDIANLTVGAYPEVAWVYFEFSRSKTGEICRGVSTPDVCMYLRDYLVVRKGRFGEPLFVGVRGAALDNGSISEILHGIIVRSGLDKVPGFIPYCLRHGLEDALTDAEIYHKTKESLMGYEADISHVYGSQRKMEQRMVETMQKVYPLICLTGDRSVVGGGVLSEETLKSLIRLLPDLEELVREKRKEVDKKS